MAIRHNMVFVNGAAVNAPEIVPGGVRRATVVDVADNSTTVSAAPAILYGIFVNTVLSAHTCPITDDVVTILTLVASAAAGTNLWFENGIPFNTSLIVNPNDAATGSLTLVWAPQ